MVSVVFQDEAECRIYGGGRRLAKLVERVVEIEEVPSRALETFNRCAVVRLHLEFLGSWMNLTWDDDAHLNPGNDTRNRVVILRWYKSDSLVDRYKASRVLDAVEIDRVSTLPRATSQARKSDRVSEMSDVRRVVSISLRYSI